MTWLLATACGTALAAPLHFPGDFREGGGISEYRLSAFVAGAIFGAISAIPLGLLQYFVLRRFVPVRARDWLLATTMAIAVAHGLSDSLPRDIPLAVVALSSAMVIGVGQWMALRPFLSNSWAWPLISALSWCAAWWTGLWVVRRSELLERDWYRGLDIQSHGLFAVAFGIVTGVITSLAVQNIVGSRNSLGN